MKLLKSSSSVLILSHFFIHPFKNESTSTVIRKFLIDKVKKIVQIEQPFPESKEKYSLEYFYLDAKLKNRIKFQSIKKPYWLSYLIDPINVIYRVLNTFSKYDFCIACDNLSFISVLPLKKIGLIKKLVYYSVDYMEIRFQNRLLNSIYHLIDKIACQNSDENWVVAKVQIEGRKENGLLVDKCAHFKVVPIGFVNREINVLNTSQINYYNLIFCGGLRESAGPQLAIGALPDIIKEFPKITLTIIGDGEYRINLEKLAINLGVSKRVKFLGMIISHKKIVKILTKCSIGLAPYAPIPGSISYRSDPGKIKLYLACGLPVITTKIATSHNVITANKAGIVIDFDEQDLAKAIYQVLKNKERYGTYRKRAISLSKRYDSDRILTYAFKDI